ncbi:EVE domain-containing protein [Tenacibaculum discolor]|uniref:EVE domain-containing protein n=1 Tax=Tenacibaculum discolor TaxID=361581 RepID=UPI000EAE7330|nr:EVE domain-containing protein [Tenacibaculum discolor]RLK03069.1 EVE domain-containing protein [Tenacibaculum discolor]
MDNKKPKYWIITASKEHVKNGIKGGFAQACHGKAAPLQKMKTNDFVIYYSSKQFFNKKDKCQEFTAIGKVQNDTVYPIEISPNFCPFRLDINFFNAKDIPILPLINDLEFIINKQKWGYPFRWGTLEISEPDFKLISSHMLYEEHH